MAATGKSNKTQVSSEPVAVSLHPRRARMEKLGTYGLQSPGFHLNNSADAAEASEQAMKVLEAERTVERAVDSGVPEAPAPAGDGMTDSVSHDAKRQAEIKAAEEKAAKKAQEKADKAAKEAEKKAQKAAAEKAKKAAKPKEVKKSAPVTPSNPPEGDGTAPVEAGNVAPAGDAEAKK